MASLESFAGAGVTATRTAATQTISITGGLLQVTGYLDANTVPPGWRIDCSSGGGLAFNLPDTHDRPQSIAGRAGAALTVGTSDFDYSVTGDQVEKVGDLGDLENGTIYYVEKGTSPTIYLHPSRAEALAGQSATRVSAGTGAIPFGNRIEYSAGRRDIGTIGDIDGPEVQIIERADAHPFRGDNYNSASEVCRFQAGKVTLRNFYWESLRPNGSTDASRSDFDIAPGAAPVFERGEIATLAQFNHLASSHIVLDRVRFRNRTAAAGAWAFELAAALATQPRELSILPTGRAIGVLGVFLTDGVPLKIADAVGLSEQASAGFGGIELGTFNPSGSNLTNSQADAKVIWLVDPAGSPGKRSMRGIVEIRRAVRLDFGTEATGTGGSCRLIPTDENPPYTLDTVHADATGPHLFPEVLHKRAAGGTYAYTAFANYRWIKVSPSYRKATGTFAVAEQSEAGQTQTVSHALVREVWPDGTNYAHTAVTTCASVDDVYRAVKAHELANPKDGGAAVSIAVMNADGYIEMGAGFHLVLSSSATDLTSWDADTDTLTVKASATVAASSNGVVGIEASGDGTITTAGTVDISAFLSKTATTQNSRVTATAAEVGVKLALFASDGTQIGTHTTAAGSLSATFGATAAQSTTGCRLLASRAGYEPQTRTLDLSAGGTFSETFGTLREVTQFDGSANYAAARVSSVSTVTFNVSDLANVRATIEVANETMGVLEAFSTFASKAQTTAGGQKYLAFGGTLPTAVAAFTGDILALPAGVNIKRRASGDVNATVGATVTAPDGATILDESNGAVQLIGGVQLADFQRAIFSDWDLDPEEAGTQSLGAKLLSIGTIASANATAIAALPGSATIVDAVLGASVETGGDTVKQALARTSDIPTTAAPSAATVRDGILGAEVETGGDTVKEALARTSDIPTTAAPTAAAVRDAVLGASVANGGDTAKQALARLAGLPSASDVTASVMGFTIAGGHDMEKAMQVALAVLGGEAAVSGSTVTYSVGGTDIISATVSGNGSRSSVSIP